MTMERVVAKFQGFREADQATREYYLSLSPAERLEILFKLRAFEHKESDGSSPRWARVYRIVKFEDLRRQDEADLEALGATD